MTPGVEPTVALALTDNTPLAASVMPLGNAAPLAETPNVPPRTTPVGRVSLRFQVDARPVTKDRV
jgi:hypothetical protein